ncbi:FAD-dependent oxidoreductase [Streptomyces sp. NPDC007205]|uniref:FAD-dependent oxidoreductase n=1 Tax=Streptomyces sp. NPDC007205 TaxID=3154316 RepID=UPI0033C052F0
MKQSSDSSSAVLVIGGGVSGLTTSLVLARRGHRVRLLAASSAEQTVSTVAGALWEFPPAVCGQHGNPLSLSRSKAWCVSSYQEFERIASQGPQTGVRMVEADFYFTSPVKTDRVERGKLAELTSLSERGVLRELRILSDDELAAVPERFGVVEGYRIVVPAIDTPRYIPWLRRKAVAAGVELVRSGCSGPAQRVTGPLIPQEARLRRAFGVDAIVNCAGMGAAELAGATMVPLRGLLWRIPRALFPDGVGPQRACVMAKSRHAQDMVFVVPRTDEVVLGGLVEPSEYDVSIGKEYEPARQMFERCREFLPEWLGPLCLDDPRIQPTVGLRPYRLENVCVARDYGFNITHNFGHGGSGFSFSYGCAEEVADLVESYASPALTSLHNAAVD